jgi:hypothetical protein
MKLNIPRILGAVSLSAVLLVGCGAVVSELPSSPQKAKAVQLEVALPVYEDEYVELEYYITDKDDQYYYGKGDYVEYPGIVFTQEYLPGGEVLNVGDVIYAVFEADNLDDGLLEVRLGGKADE